MRIKKSLIFSEEHKKKIGLAHKGLKHTADTRAKMSAAHMGHEVTEETKRKIRESNLGQKRSLEFREKISLIKRPSGPAISRNDLYHFYIIENMTDAEIALKVGAPRRHIKTIRRKYGIYPTQAQWSLRKSMAAKKIVNPNVGKKGKENPMYGKRGKDCHNWKGGRTVHPDGYVYLYTPNHPCRNAQGYMLEHRLVIEKYLGRNLRPREVAHHLNGEEGDNRPENLMAFKGQGAHLRFEKGGRVHPEEILFDGRLFKH